MPFHDISRPCALYGLRPWRQSDGAVLVRVHGAGRAHRVWPVKDQWKQLCMCICGHNGYYGIIGNKAGLDVFRDQVRRAWQKWLN